MIITYLSQSSNAQLKLGLMSSVEGGLIYDGLVWEIGFFKKNKKLQTLTSNTPQPLFNELMPGTYEIRVKIDEKLVMLGELNLEAGYLTNAVFILNNAALNAFDADTEHQRRLADRASQPAPSTTPLKEPKHNQDFEAGVLEQESILKSHPILSKKTQFRGSPEVSPCNNNIESIKKTLELNKQNMPQPSSIPTPRLG